MNPQPEDRSRIDQMKSSLYSRGAPDIRTKRRLRFSSAVPLGEVKTDWEHPQEKVDLVELNKIYKDNSMSFFTKLLMFSIVIFLIAIGIGAYLVFNGSNIVSANNVDITINGPISVAGGEPISFDVQVLNKNNIKLQTVDLSVEFPSGTVDSTDTSKELKKFRELLPDIDPGSYEKKTIEATLYGEENSKKEIKVVVEYRVNGSNAIFQKEKTFDILVSSSPLNVSVSSFKEVNSGQEFDLNVSMVSNSKETLKNIILKSTYPFGFSFINSDPKPLSDNNTWKIGDIPPGAKKTIKIRGKLDGQDDETRIFRFSTGSASVRDEKIIGTEYVSTTQEISIKKPFISIGASLDGNSEDQEYVGSFDNPIKVEISYFNNLPTPILDGEIHVKLSGSAFDKSSVSPEQGLYRSADNEIVWNSITTSDLRNISAGESGRVSFSIVPRNLSNSSKQISNPDVKLSISVQGKRNSETNVPESITSTAKRNIKISSNVSLSGQIVRSSGPFENVGPIPPKAEQYTTYTVIWTVDNTSNSVTGAQVRASLPPYVKWLNKISPSGESVTYNSVDGQLVWKIGNIDKNTSNSTKRRQVAFQISINPSITQVGQVPVLINQATLTAQDDFTNQTLTNNLSQMTTRFSSDPLFKDGDERVAK